MMTTPREVRHSYLMLMPFFVSSGLMVSKNFIYGIISLLVCILLLFFPFYKSLIIKKYKLYTVIFLLGSSLLFGLLLHYQLVNISIIRFLMVLVILFSIIKLTR